MPNAGMKALNFPKNYTKEIQICLKCSAKAVFLRQLTHKISKCPTLGSVGHRPKKFAAVSYCFDHLSLVLLALSHNI